mmetsp:Transcript_22029/g.39634  ORF Transcript_22029/g.39634 Transcript_22029/m.39634 type:complete len:310 (-) Transcript_22029:3033-3962(-)
MQNGHSDFPGVPLVFSFSISDCWQVEARAVSRSLSELSRRTSETNGLSTVSLHSSRAFTAILRGVQGFKSTDCWLKGFSAVASVCVACTSNSTLQPSADIGTRAPHLFISISSLACSSWFLRSCQMHICRCASSSSDATSAWAAATSLVETAMRSSAWANCMLASSSCNISLHRSAADSQDICRLRSSAIKLLSSKPNSWRSNDCWPSVTCLVASSSSNSNLTFSCWVDSRPADCTSTVGSPLHCRHFASPERARCFAPCCCCIAAAHMLACMDDSKVHMARCSLAMTARCSRSLQVTLHCGALWSASD